MERAMRMDLSAWPALADATHDSQRLFRRILAALSEPGMLTTLELSRPPTQLGAALWGALLTLCDLETRLWIAADLDSPDLREAVAFHTGARLVETSEAADFALLTAGSFDPGITFAQGTDSYPDRSTTLLVAVPRLVNRQGWQLSGPGIAGSRYLDIGDDAGCCALMTRLAANRGTFPRGLDAFLAAGDQLAAIPRSTRIADTHLEEVN